MIFKGESSKYDMSTFMNCKLLNISAELSTNIIEKTSSLVFIKYKNPNIVEITIWNLFSFIDTII